MIQKWAIRAAVILMVLCVPVVIFGLLTVRYFNVLASIPSNESLNTALRTADRVQIFTTDTSLPIREKEFGGDLPYTPKELFEIEGGQTAAGLISKMKIVPTEHPGFFAIDLNTGSFICLCGGEFEMRFWEGENHLASISFHHLESLRWLDGPWSGNAVLEEGAGEEIVGFLRESGFTDIGDLFSDSNMHNK